MDSKQIIAYTVESSLHGTLGPNVSDLTKHIMPGKLILEIIRKTFSQRQKRRQER